MIAKFASAVTMIALAAGVATLSTMPNDARAQTPSETIRKELAPTGKFRLSFVAANVLIVRKDADTGEFRGIVAEIGKAVAAHLNVPFEAVAYPEVVSLNKSTGTGTWDAVMRSFDARRADELAFTPPFMEVESSFLVGPESPLRHIDEIDRPGIRIAFSRGSVIDNFFQKNPLKHATIERTTGPGPAIEMVKAGQADAFAQNREFLTVVSQQISGFRVLDGSYETLGFSLAVPKASSAAAEYLSKLIEDWKASGFIREAMARSGLKSAKVAPPSKL